ncbi:DUF2142 domain-containing protein [Diaminobutyricibacter sp. McL0608]|uniref:DUF2142 domain-containing protein n=1 Tax=Leifsonia sp. McL0608 TaxID=3143537 RepID=UPI0031F2F4E8
MQFTETEPRRASRFGSIILVPVFALIALMCWAFASPIGSSPDDDFHLTSIWCGLGERPGLCEAVPGHPDQRAVPFAVGETNCNRHFVGSVETCPIDGLGAGSMIATARGNFSGEYPPVYYAAMSVFASTNFTVSILLMRAINVLLFVGITSLLYYLLGPSRRRTLVWTWSIVIVPLGAFLIASNNPSAWAVISGGTLWLALVGYFERRGWRSIVLGCVAALAAVMGAGARADAAIYSVIAVGLALLMTVARTREFWLKAILPLGIVIVAGLFYLVSNQSSVASGGLTGTHPPSATGGFGLLWNNLLQVPSLWSGVLGSWGLGWLDTIMPAVVPVLGVLAFGAATYTGLVSMSARKLVSLVIALAALVAIPVWVLTKSSAVVGQEVQPRYIMPLVIIFAGVALLQANGRPILFTRLQAIVVVIGVSVANAAALHTTMRRYISGFNVFDWNLDHFQHWWWTGAVPPMAVWVVGMLAFAAAVYFALAHAPRERTMLPASVA